MFSTIKSALGFDDDDEKKISVYARERKLFEIKTVTELIKALEQINRDANTFRNTIQFEISITNEIRDHFTKIMHTNNKPFTIESLFDVLKELSPMLSLVDTTKETKVKSNEHNYKHLTFPSLFIWQYLICKAKTPFAKSILETSKYLKTLKTKSNESYNYMISLIIEYCFMTCGYSIDTVSMKTNDNWENTECLLLSALLIDILNLPNNTHENSMNFFVTELTKSLITSKSEKKYEFLVHVFSMVIEYIKDHNKSTTDVNVLMKRMISMFFLIFEKLISYDKEAHNFVTNTIMIINYNRINSVMDPLDNRISYDGIIYQIVTAMMINISIDTNFFQSVLLNLNHYQTKPYQENKSLIRKPLNSWDSKCEINNDYPTGVVCLRSCFMKNIINSINNPNVNQEKYSSILCDLFVILCHSCCSCIGESIDEITKYPSNEFCMNFAERLTGLLEERKSMKIIVKSKSSDGSKVTTKSINLFEKSKLTPGYSLNSIHDFKAPKKEIKQEIIEEIKQENPKEENIDSIEDAIVPDLEKQEVPMEIINEKEIIEEKKEETEKLFKRTTNQKPIIGEVPKNKKRNKRKKNKKNNKEKID